MSSRSLATAADSVSRLSASFRLRGGQGGHARRPGPPAGPATRPPLTPAVCPQQRTRTGRWRPCRWPSRSPGTHPPCPGAGPGVPGAHHAARRSGPGCLRGERGAQDRRTAGQRWEQCWGQPQLCCPPRDLPGSGGTRELLSCSWTRKALGKADASAAARGAGLPHPVLTQGVSAAAAPAPTTATFGRTRQAEQGEGHHHGSHLGAEPGGRVRELGGEAEAEPPAPARGVPAALEAAGWLRPLPVPLRPGGAAGLGSCRSSPGSHRLCPVAAVLLLVLSEPRRPRRRYLCRSGQFPVR